MGQVNCLPSKVFIARIDQLHKILLEKPVARVTVEDCLDNVDNRFELIMVATKRARQIATGGHEPMVAEENDKPTVIALREIAEGKVGPSILLTMNED